MVDLSIAFTDTKGLNVKQPSLRDVATALQEATDALEAIERRSLYESPPELSFEQRVIDAARKMSDGHPLKDYLSMDDLEQVVNILSDIYTVTGVRMPDNWF